MSYLSRIDIRLPSQPIITDPEDFGNFLPVYNAIHMLNSSLEQFWDNFESGDETKKPSEAMKFLRWFYATCAVRFKAGDVVSAVRRAHAYNPDTEEFGAIVGWCPGAPSNFTLDAGQAPPTLGMGMVGFAMEDGEPGQLAKIGVGPAVVEVEGDVLKLGQCLFARPSMTKENGIGAAGESIFDGNLYTVPIFTDLVVIGGVVADNMAMIYPMVDYYGMLAARGAFVPGVSDGGGS